MDFLSFSLSSASRGSPATGLSSSPQDGLPSITKHFHNFYNNVRPPFKYFQLDESVLSNTKTDDHSWELQQEWKKMEDIFAVGSETSSTSVEWAMSKMLNNPRVTKEAQAEDIFAVGSETLSTTVEWAMSEMLKNPRVMKEAQAEDIFIAGSETLSTTVEWAKSEMLKNRRVIKEAKAEVRHVFDRKGKVDETSINELKFLKAVIKETLRLHPAAPFLVPRENSDSCQINGYEIPAKTRTVVNAWAIARDPKYWTEAEKFNLSDELAVFSDT
ncbi:hypothetical protein Q3G72_014229 [Acer saccharum]|nr:hypothetical protein Q3G72_014229 [Acer saccharum]